MCIIASIPSIQVHVSFWLTIEAICQSFVFSDNIQNEARFLLILQLFPPLLILHQEILLVPLNLLQLLLARGVGFNLMIELIMKSSKTTYHRSQLIKISVLDKSGNKSIWSYLLNYKFEGHSYMILTAENQYFMMKLEKKLKGVYSL